MFSPEMCKPKEGVVSAYIIFVVDVKDHERYPQNRDLIQPTLEPYDQPGLGGEGPEIRDRGLGGMPPAGHRRRLAAPAPASIWRRACDTG